MLGHDHVVDHAVLREVLAGEQRRARRRARRAVRVVVGELEALGAQPLAPRQLAPTAAASRGGAPGRRRPAGCSAACHRVPHCLAWTSARQFGSVTPCWRSATSAAPPHWWTGDRDARGRAQRRTSSSSSCAAARTSCSCPATPDAGDAPFDLMVDDLDATHTRRGPSSGVDVERHHARAASTTAFTRDRPRRLRRDGQQLPRRRAAV